MADRWYLIGSMKHARIVFASRPGLASLCQEMLETAPSCAVRLSGKGKRSRYTIYRAENRVAPSEVVVRKRCNNCGHRAGEFCGLPDGTECDGAKCWVPEKTLVKVPSSASPFDESGRFTCPLCGENGYSANPQGNSGWRVRCHNIACYYSWFEPRPSPRVGASEQRKQGISPMCLTPNPAHPGAACALLSGHAGKHKNGTVEWDSPQESAPKPPTRITDKPEMVFVEGHWLMIDGVWANKDKPGWEIVIVGGGTCTLGSYVQFHDRPSNKTVEGKLVPRETPVHFMSVSMLLAEFEPARRLDPAKSHPLRVGDEWQQTTNRNLRAKITSFEGCNADEGQEARGTVHIHVYHTEDEYKPADLTCEYPRFLQFWEPVPHPINRNSVWWAKDGDGSATVIDQLGNGTVIYDFSGSSAREITRLRLPEKDWRSKFEYVKDVVVK